MKKIIALPIFFFLLISLGSCRAFAHEAVRLEDVEIEAEWKTEPAIVGQFNSIELVVKDLTDGTPLPEYDMDVSIKKGGITKQLELNLEEPGVYIADVIPTQVGKYSLVIETEGRVAAEIELDDVQSTAGMSFPDSKSSSDTGTNELLQQLSSAISDIELQVIGIKTAAEDAKRGAEASSTDFDVTKAAVDRAYLVGIAGVGAGITGIIVAVYALSHKQEQ
jgi:hypothetical protein